MFGDNADLKYSTLKSLLVILKSYSEIRFYSPLNFNHQSIEISTI